MLRAIVLLLVAAGSSPLLAQTTNARLRLPGSFPEQLATVVLARLEGDTAATTFSGSDPRIAGQTFLAQREVGTDRVWLAVEFAPSGRSSETQTLELPLRPTTLESDVSVAAEEHGLVFRDRDRPVVFYRRDPKEQGEIRRAHYLHPLWSLDGQSLTEEFPEDHLHHQGVFWAWHQLWVGDQKVGDPWVARDFLVVVQETRVLAEGPVFAALRVRAHWTSPLVTDQQGVPRPIVEEVTILRVFRRQGDTQYVDVEIQIRPLLEGVRLGGAENERGYSGFTVRVRPPADLQIHHAGGLLTEDLIGGRSSWADVSGHFGGSDPQSGLAILTHPALPEFPPRWLLRHYGMQNVLYPGQEPILLSAASPLVLSHRLVIHRHDHSAARVADHQRVYEALAAR
jgi:hypothetical protein